jgi:hypothetical protein
MTQLELKELITYDPKTGIIKWKETKKGRRIKPENISDGSLNRQGYIIFGLCGKRYKAHRLAFLYMNGSFPKEEVDHINGVKSDNRWENLREATRHQNRLNDKAKGYYKEYGKYKAQIRFNHKHIFLGYYETEEEAHKAYLAGKIKYHGKEFSTRALA